MNPSPIPPAIATNGGGGGDFLAYGVGGTLTRYRVIVRKSVSKDLQGIPQKDVRRILSAIKSLADDPRPPGAKKLSGQDRYRLRQGNYRILYEIEDDRLILCVVRAGDRRDIYR